MKAILLKFRFIPDDFASDRVSIVDTDYDPATERSKCIIGLTFDQMREWSCCNLRNPMSYGIGNSMHLPREQAVQARLHLRGMIADAPDDVLFLPTNESVGADVLMSQGLTPSRVLGALAVAGIETCMPALPVLPDEELLELKDRCKPEREGYLASLGTHLADARTRIRAGDYVDAAEYAQWETSPRLKLAVLEYERAAQCASVSLLARLNAKLAERSEMIAGTVTTFVVCPNQATAAAALSSIIAPTASALVDHARRDGVPSLPFGIKYLVRIRETVRTAN